MKGDEACRKRPWIESATQGLGIALEQRAEPMQKQFATAMGARMPALHEEPLYVTLATLGIRAPDFAARLMPALEVTATSSDRLHGMAMGLGRGGYARHEEAFKALVQRVLQAQSGHDRAIQCFTSGFAYAVDEATFDQWAPIFRSCCGDDVRLLKVVDEGLQIGRDARLKMAERKSDGVSPAPKSAADKG